MYVVQGIIRYLARCTKVTPSKKTHGVVQMLIFVLAILLLLAIIIGCMLGNQLHQRGSPEQQITRGGTLGKQLDQQGSPEQHRRVLKLGSVPSRHHRPRPTPIHFKDESVATRLEQEPHTYEGGFKEAIHFSPPLSAVKCCTIVGYIGKSLTGNGFRSIELSKDMKQLNYVTQDNVKHVSMFDSRGNLNTDTVAISTHTQDGYVSGTIDLSKIGVDGISLLLAHTGKQLDQQGSPEQHRNQC